MAHGFKENDFQDSVFATTAFHQSRLDALMHQFRDVSMDLADDLLVLLAQDQLKMIASYAYTTSTRGQFV